MKATVLMSVYNAEKYIDEVITSVLKQTFENFEFIIINDASTDGTEEHLKQYQDSRIRLIRNKHNIGLTRSLNRGLRLAKGEYIVRIDADDICYSNRLEKQIAYMDANKDIMLSSCGLKFIGKTNEKYYVNYNAAQIKGRLVFWTVLPHPGFIFRKTLIDEGFYYDNAMKYAQDYDFQVRVSQKYPISCMRDILVYYRVSDKQISEEKFAEQQKYANITRIRQFSRYGVKLGTRTAKAIQLLCLKQIEKMKFVQLIEAMQAIIHLKFNVERMECREKDVIIYLCEYFHSQIKKEIGLRLKTYAKSNG